MIIKLNCFIGPLLLALVALTLSATAQDKQVPRVPFSQDQASADSKAIATGNRRAIFFSESKLRAVIEMTNLELRQLKRDFMKQMTDLYLRLKLDQTVGFEEARDKASFGSSANVLLAEEFATIAIKKLIIQRRLLTGLKLAFVKFLPMQTLVNLFRRYKSFEWLKDQEQVDLRAKFPNAKENQFIILYTLIELRARVRAADDVVALTSNNIRRVLQMAQRYLVESDHGPEINGAELAALALNSKLVLQFYEAHILSWQQKLHETYDSFLQSARALEQTLGGRRALVEFIDRLIDVEALDIDLNTEAQSLEFPPTINEQMVQKVEKRWIPWYVLKSLEEDRKLLIENRKRVMHLIAMEANKKDANLFEWTSNVLDYICHNEVTLYPTRRLY